MVGATALYGPIQLVVVGFERAAIPLDVVNQLRKVRDAGIVRLVDAVFVAKDEHGDLTAIQATDLSKDEVVLLGTLAGALFGYGAAGDDGLEIGADLGGLAAEEGEFGLDEDDINAIADLIPTGTAALFMLLEHLWAIGLKEAFQNAGGSILSHGWITPRTLIALGQEAATETATA
jgi:uncharacterized membrane protein